MSSKVKPLYLFLILSLILAACGPTGTQETQEPVAETMVLTEVVQTTPVEVIQVATPSSEPEDPRTLVICLEEEPGWDNMFEALPYTENHFQEAIEDGPIDTNSFAYRPVILEKLPSLVDGDAILTKVTVSEGDTVVAADCEVVTLDPAADPLIMLIPAGGGEPVPYQGGDFELDQMTVIWKLLPGLVWSDGAPLTAMDSVYTFNTFESEWRVQRTSSYKAIDERTIQWTGLPGLIEEIYPIVLSRPRPEHIWGQYSPDELLESEELLHNPVGWGPYIVDEWTPGETIILQKNPNYFRAGEGLPKFDRLVFRFIGDNPNTNIAALLAGECDLVTAPLDDQVELLLELHEAGKLKATISPGDIWEHLDFGIQHIDYDDGYQPAMDRPDFFSDVRMRQGFAMCMDRQALVDTLFYGQSLVPDSYLPPQHPFYNPEVRHYEFDVAAGSALLEEVGWLDHDSDPDTPRVAQGVPNVPDGTSLEVDYETSSTPIRQQVTSMIQESLAKCGIKTNIRLYDFSEFWEGSPESKLFGRRYDLFQLAWSTDPTPPCHFYLSRNTPGPTDANLISIQDGLERTFGDAGWWGANWMGFANDEYDRACNTAFTSLPGQPKYEATHLEAQKIFAEQLPSVPLYNWIKVFATRPDMCGVIMDPSVFSALWNIEEFDYGEGCQE